MKKIITMVGTSIFEKYSEEKKDISSHIEELMHKESEKYKDEKSRVDFIKEKVINWIDEKEEASAEIKSIIKLKEKFNLPFEIYLLCSDTILSKCAAEILFEAFNNFDILRDCEVIFNEDSIIKGLQVKDADLFRKEGLYNLIKKIDEISSGYTENLIINITGGYKVVIPFLTVYAQINKIPLYYIFEDTEELIEVPPVPLQISYGLIEKYSHILKELEKGVLDFKGFKEKYKYDPFYEDLKSLIWVSEKDNIAELNPLGKMIYQRYKNYLNIFVPLKSKYFNLSEPKKRVLHNAVLECYERLSSVIPRNKTKEEIIKFIINLGENNDLRHGPVIDKEKGVFTFKSTNETHVRFSYSFEIDKEGDISKIYIYSFVLESFEHDKYLENFKKEYEVLKMQEIEWFPIPLKKEEDR